jgi:anti-sigma B factor antagonist
MEETNQFRMEMRELGKGIVLDLAGELSAPYSDRLLHALEEYQSTGINDIILNFEDLEYISDEAIGQLKWMLDRLRSQGGDLKIINIAPSLKVRFDTLGVSETFNIHLPKRFWDRERWIGTLRRLGIYFSRRTGLRVSTFVLILFIIAWVGWFVSLRNLIHLQSKQMAELNSEITYLQRKVFVLESQRSRYQRQTKELKDRLAPLEAIGFFTDSFDILASDSGKIGVITDATPLENSLLPGSELVDSLAEGDSVVVLTRYGSRVKIQTVSGQEGWISEENLMESDEEILDSMAR